MPRVPLSSGAVVPCTPYLDEMFAAGPQNPVRRRVPDAASYGAALAKGLLSFLVIWKISRSLDKAECGLGVFKRDWISLRQS